MAKGVRKNETRLFMSKTPFYKVWKGMRERCAYTKHKYYQYYGGRGIKVDAKWLDFKCFYYDMYPSYIYGLHLDRIDSNGDYCKENCHWVTRQENMNNRRDNVIIEMEGRSLTMAQWCRELNCNYDTIRHRIKKRIYLDDIFQIGKQTSIYKKGNQIAILQSL